MSQNRKEAEIMMKNIIIAVLIIGLVLVSGCLESDDSGESADDIGKTIETERVKVTLLKIDSPKYYTYYDFKEEKERTHGSSERYEIKAVQVKIENIGTETFSMSSSCFTLVDSTTKIISTPYESYLFTKEEGVYNPIFYAEGKGVRTDESLSPNKAVERSILFDIAKSESVVRLSFNPSCINDQHTYLYWNI